MSSKSFNVFYTGWCPVNGLYGDVFVKPIFEHIIATRNNQMDFIPERLQLTIQKQQIRILKEIHNQNKSIKIYSDYPNIPMLDITYATKINNGNKIYVCLIVLGYDPDTGNPAHLHIYELIDYESVAHFLYLVNRKINQPALRKRAIEIEKMLIEEGKISSSQLKDVKLHNDKHHYLSSNSTNASATGSWNNTKDIKEIKKLSLSNNNIPRSTSSVLSRKSADQVDSDFIATKSHQNKILVNEFKNKLKDNDVILLPPRDYDTIHRRFGRTDLNINRSILPRDHLPFSEMN